MQNPKYFEIDNLYYSSLIVVNYYREQTDLLLKNLIETNINMNISIFYEKQDSYKTIKDLTYHIGNVGVELKEANENRQDIDIASYTYNDAKYIRKEIQVNNEELYFLYIYINLYSKDINELEYNLNKIEGISQSKGMQTRRANFRQEECFLAGLPIMENKEIIKEAASKIDFMGVNYYQTSVCEYNPIDGVTPYGTFNTTGVKGSGQVTGQPGLFKNPSNPYLKTTDWDWTIDPMGLRYALREITSRYNLPIIISENGLGAFDKKEEDNSIHDPYRIAFLKAHIEEMKIAIEEGCEVIAYCTWSFTDLLSWLNGYQKRYGFVYVDREEEEGSSMNRYKKDSYYWYKKVIETNGDEV